MTASLERQLNGAHHAFRIVEHVRTEGYHLARFQQPSDILHRRRLHFADHVMPLQHALLLELQAPSGTGADSALSGLPTAGRKRTPFSHLCR